MPKELDSWNIWIRDVEEFRTTLPCQGRKFRWLKGYLGNPESKIMFVCEMPSLSKRFTQQQPPDSTDENLQWNVHEGDWLFREMLCEFGFKENSAKEAGGWKCWITDFIKCPMGNLSKLDVRTRNEIVLKSSQILEREIELLCPALIVTVGNNAYNYLKKYIKGNVPKPEKLTHYSYVMLRPDRGRKAGDPERIEEYREEFRRIKKIYSERVNKRSIEDYTIQTEKSVNSEKNRISRATIEELMSMMLTKIPELGDDIRRCDLTSRIRFEREGFGGRERRIVALVQYQNNITAHLPRNRTFKSKVDLMSLWQGALSYDKRGFSYLKKIDSEERARIALEVIRIAYHSLNQKYKERFEAR